MINKRPIYLIGFMASGKSTLARALSKRSGMSYMDTDHYIQDETKSPIHKIFELYGENYFRFIEAQICRRCQGNIVATGGGAPMYYQTMDWMLQNGTVVYVNCTFDLIYHRLKVDRENRPLAKGDNLENLSTLFDQRKSTYERAHINLQASGNLEQDLNKLILLIGER